MEDEFDLIWISKEGIPRRETISYGKPEDYISYLEYACARDIKVNINGVEVDYNVSTSTKANLSSI